MCFVLLYKNTRIHIHTYKIYKDKEHYIHQKPTRQLGKHTKQYKKQLVGQCTRPWQSPQHRWAPHRSGYQCGACGLRLHQGLTVQEIELRLKQECQQLTLDEQHPEQASPHQALPKKQTRAQVIKNLLETQAQNQPETAQHQFEATTGYLRCVKCGTSIHKRVNEAAFLTYLASRCLDQPYTEAHSGHSSHALWQKGEKVSCTQCGLSLHLDGQQRIILTGDLKKPCKGAAISGSPPLPELFRKQVEQATQKANSQDDSQEQTLSTAASDRAAYQHPSTAPCLDTTIQASPNQGPNRGPTPRRLHFSTAFDSLTSDTTPATTALAMNPSQQTVDENREQKKARLEADTTMRTESVHEQDEEESRAEDDACNVDFF